MQGNVAMLEKLSSVVEKTVERDEGLKTISQAWQRFLALLIEANFAT